VNCRRRREKFKSPSTTPSRRCLAEDTTGQLSSFKTMKLAPPQAHNAKLENPFEAMAKPQRGFPQPQRE